MKSGKPKRIVKRKPTENDENDYDSDESFTPVSNKSQKGSKKKSQCTHDSDYAPSCSQSQNLSPLSQISKEMTDYEKEMMVDIVIKRIYTKYFGTQKTFKKASMFLPTDKVSSKNQSILIPMIAEKIKQKLRVDLIKDEDRYMFSLPKDFKKDYDSLTANFQTVDKTFFMLTSLILSLIYSHKGHISEELIHRRIQFLIPNLDTFDSPYKDISKVLQELEQRAYINKRLNLPVGDNPPTATFFWGHRARIEVDKKTLLPYLCMFFSVSSPTGLPIWLKEAIEEDVDFNCD